MTRVLLLAARTSRSQAYAQALSHAGMAVEAALVMDNGVPFKTMPPGAGWAQSPVFLPDLSIPLEGTLENVAGETLRMQAAGVNDPAVREALLDLRPDLVLYSGYGGQIVGREALGLGIPFLHFHSGLLPEFRGSTTIYYSILAERRCGVSAISLNDAIDMGGVISRRAYPLPPPGLDIDYVYDNAIRADLLLHVLASVRTDGLPKAAPQEERSGETYYIIHPVLKHLAILSLKEGVDARNKG